MNGREAEQAGLKWPARVRQLRLEAMHRLTPFQTHSLSDGPSGACIHNQQNELPSNAYKIISLVYLYINGALGQVSLLLGLAYTDTSLHIYELHLETLNIRLYVYVYVLHIFGTYAIHSLKNGRYIIKGMYLLIFFACICIYSAFFCICRLQILAY